MPVSPTRYNKHLWLALFILWALQGFMVFRQFISTPSDSDTAVLIGLSAQRLAAGALLLSWGLLNLVIAFLVIRLPSRMENWLDLSKRPRLWDVVFVLALILTIVSQGTLAVVWGLSRQGEIQVYATYTERLSPFLNLVTLASLEIAGLIIYYRAYALAEFKTSLSLMLKKGVVIWGIMALIAGVITLTGLGIIPTGHGDWSRGLPAVPLLEWQILLAGLVCLGMLVAEIRINPQRIRHFDLWICLAIWLGTVALWLSQPVIPNPSALKPHEPNFEVYPFIDAQVYDEYAQSLLIGNGFKNVEIPQRPLYIVFLALMHTVAGQDYDRMITLQSLFLANLPVLLFLLGKELYGRPVGIAIALLATLRDFTSNIAAPFTGNLSYSKVYLSEIPVAIFLILFVLLGIRWIKEGLPGYSAFITGGILGIAMLIRTQAVAALPVILLIAFLTDHKRLGALLRKAILMSLGIILVIAPWLWRNWQITGELLFDNPRTQTMNLALRYSRLNGMDPDILPAPGETSADYNDRLIRIAVQAISADPGEAAKGVVNHFLNHCVDNILLFPLRNDLVDLAELWRPSRAFWEMWIGWPTLSQSALLGFYGLLFGLGVAAAWNKNGWAGLTPLGINLLYNLWTSLSLLSGQRFLLAMDWSVYLYYMIGIFALVRGILFLLESARSMTLSWNKLNASAPVRAPTDKHWQHFALAGLLFLFVGASLPLSEAVFPQRYPASTQGQLLSEFTRSAVFQQSGINTACLLGILEGHRLRIEQGRALSPRYYEAGDGESFTDKAGYRVTDEARLIFYLVGSGYGLVILPLSEAPDFFPNASDVMVIRDGRAWFVIVKQGETEKLYVSDIFDPSACK